MNVAYKASKVCDEMEHEFGEDEGCRSHLHKLIMKHFAPMPRKLDQDKYISAGECPMCKEPIQDGQELCAVSSRVCHSRCVELDDDVPEKKKPVHHLDVVKAVQRECNGNQWVGPGERCRGCAKCQPASEVRTRCLTCGHDKIEHHSQGGCCGADSKCLCPVFEYWETPAQMEIREVASRVINALCLPGHPIEDAWEHLCILTGRACQPFMSRFKGYDNEPRRPGLQAPSLEKPS